MKGVSLMTAEKRVEWLNKSQDNVQAVFNLLKASEITVEQEGRLASEPLQLIAGLISTLIDLSDSVAPRSQVR